MSLISTDPNDATGAAAIVSDSSPATRGPRYSQFVSRTMPGAVRAGPHGMRLVGSVLERTLLRLLGPDAPVELLLERALLAALGSWPAGDEPPSLLWGQRLAVTAAREYLKQLGPKGVEQWRTTRPGRAREVIAHLQVWLRASRPEEQLAFTLLELNGSSVCEAAALLGSSPAVVRQRAARVRRQLLFAARRDLWLTRYLLIAARLRGLLRGWDRVTLHAPPSERARRISSAVELELQWFT